MRRGRLVKLAVFVVLALGAVWFLARNWYGTAVGTALSGRGTPRGAAALAPLSTTQGKSGKTAAGTTGTPGAAAAAGTTHGPSTAPRTTGAAAYFAAAHLARAQAESRELAEFAALADSPSASAAVRAEAQQQMLQTETWQRDESSAELILQAKGFPEALVLLSGTGAVAVVEAARFNAAMAAEVAQAVASAAGIDPSQVQIVTRK